jgi:hypothetical protein
MEPFVDHASDEFVLIHDKVNAFPEVVVPPARLVPQNP